MKIDFIGVLIVVVTVFILGYGVVQLLGSIAN